MPALNPHELWQATLGELELLLSKGNFSTWFKHTSIANIEGDHVTVSVPNTFTKAWLEKKYHAAIIKSLQRILEMPIREVIYRVDANADARSMPALTLPPSAPIMLKAQAAPVREITNEFGLRTNYVFQNFVVGKGSEMANAAAHAVANAIIERRVSPYNPLFIYGGAGLGKTHLMQAIGNATVAADPTRKVLYVTFENFTNEFINAIRSGRGKEFKDRYRSVDLLLIDDIQFIAGKEETQEEFFHTFNALHQVGHQVAMTSDRPPRAIQGLAERLRTRFETGLVCDVQVPDLETRIAILRAKLAEKDYSLGEQGEDILTYVAATVQSSVRDLEGALNKLIANLQVRQARPTVEFAKEVLASVMAGSGRKSISARQLIDAVASYYDLRVDDLLGKSREKKLSHPRQIVMFLMREEMRSSFPAIGNELGGRDHTTAMHACDKIRTAVPVDEKLRQDLELIKDRVYSS